MIAPVLGMNAIRSLDDAKPEQRVVRDAETVQDDVPAVGAHDDACQQRRERKRDEQPLAAAPRAHQEVGEREAEQDVEHADANADDERAREDLEIQRAREQELVVLERRLVGELLRFGLQEARRQQQRVRHDEEDEQHRRRMATSSQCVGSGFALARRRRHARRREPPLNP